MKDKLKLLHERALMMCIIMLFICIFFKLIGASWFNLETDIPILKEIDKIVMNDYLLSLMYSTILTTINIFLVTGMIKGREQNPLSKYLTVSFVIIMLSMFIKITLKNHLTFIVDLGIVYICMMVRYNRILFREFVYCISVNFIYQFISVFIRNIGMGSGQHGLIVGLLMNLDYYIFLIIHNLCIQEGGVAQCLISQVFSSFQARRHLKRHLEKSLNKEN